MNQELVFDKPSVYTELLERSAKIGFDMSSDLYIGSLLKTLIASKPGGHFLELGTGIGLSLSWMIDGMDTNSSILTVDNNPDLIEIATTYFGDDSRITLECKDAANWIKEYRGTFFDLIFADAWPGKYSELDKTISLLKKGGFYVLDDMSKQPNWPDGHENNVKNLIVALENRDDIVLTKMDWSTGVIIAVKIA